MRRGLADSFSFIATLAAFALASTLTLPGCKKTAPKSANYFALVKGNAWLFVGEEQPNIEIEMKVTQPDPSLHLREGILDVTFSGSLGTFKIGEEGIFLEATENDVKLWGVKAPGSPPRFFDTPYVWLKKPIVIGQTYNTAIRGTQSPETMRATKKVAVGTPWGAKEGFLLEDEGGNVKLVFVEYFGFVSAEIPDLPRLKIRDAELR